MKARYVIAGSVLLVLSMVVFMGVQEAKTFASKGVTAAQDPARGSAGLSQLTPSEATAYGMSREIAVWSELAELALFLGGGISLVIMGYGLVSKDETEVKIRARR